MVALRLTDEDIETAFRLFDADESGVITAQELRFALKSLGYQTVTDADVKECMKGVDGGVKGKMDLEQFSALIQGKMIEAGSDKEIQYMFNIFDFDRNGRVGLNDLARASKIATGEEASLDYIRDILKWADHDGDDQLNYKEFTNAVTKHVAAVDPRSRRAKE
ncbi:Calmodulin [Diplonema papillatum]|nr:Calmodulin [Diplonema papillatum]|eukprot:gene2775-4332_t